MQVTFSTPGIKAPTDEISDDELLETLKKIIDERTDLRREVQDLKESVNVATTAKKDIVDNTKKMKQALNEAVVSQYFCSIFYHHLFNLVAIF